jgi:hypothetical protein
LPLRFAINQIHAMKLRPHFRWLFTLLTAVSVTLPATKASPTAIVAARQTLYVSLAVADSVAFAQHCYALTTGTELYLSTLKQKAAEEAKFDGEVIVLETGATPPLGANVLRLNWSLSGVVAEFFDGSRSTPRNLGNVSATPLRFHPNFSAMHPDLFQPSSDGRSDAVVRARTRMDLFLALRGVAQAMHSTA